MRVVYDITILVNGYKKNNVRTGIVRVIEFLANELSRIREVQLNFCTIDNIFFVKDCLGFLQTKSEFKDIPLIYPIEFLVGIKRVEFLNYLQTRLASIGKIKLVDKIFKYLELKILLYHEKKYFSKKSANPTNKNVKEIYHSPFLPLSNDDLNSRQCIKFITIYDMLPIILPNFFDHGTIELLKKVYSSIDNNTWVLCISESTRKDLLKYKGNDIDPAKVFVTHLAASDYFYKSLDGNHNKIILTKYRIPHEPYILALSILDPRKNMSSIIEAFAQLVDKYSIDNLNLILVGPSGRGFESIVEFIATKPHLKDRIILTGFVDDDDLAAVYTEALMFVYPSFYEGFGLPPLEAMQCGVPVITSNTSSLPEVVSDAAIMIDPSSGAELENAMYRLYADEELRKSFSTKGVEQAMKFSWKKCAEQTIDVYRRSMQS